MHMYTCLKEHFTTNKASQQKNTTQTPCIHIEKKQFYTRFFGHTTEIQLNFYLLSSSSHCWLHGCDVTIVNRIILLLISTEPVYTIMNKKRKKKMSPKRHCFVCEWTQYFIILKPLRFYTNHVTIIILQTLNTEMWMKWEKKAFNLENEHNTTQRQRN